jgi:Sulfotransferase family
VSWKHTLNDALARTTGYELRRAGWGGRRRRPSVGRAVGGRLVAAPTFILCTLRSGSTLLRVLLNSHSQIHAPQELHLRYVGVKLKRRWGARAMQGLGLDAKELEYLLWDRILHRELAASGKERLVCKTPNDVFIADRIAECWPDARFIFLLRHPAAIVRSRKSLGPGVDAEKNVELIRRYCEALESARQSHPGHTVRYEELTTDPEAVVRGICEFLGVPWEPEMLEYGRFDHGRFRPGLGDWKSKIKTGEVQPAAPLPSAEEIPAVLRDVAAAWGYLPEGTALPAARGRETLLSDAGQ